MQAYDITGNWIVLFAGQGLARPGMGADIIDSSAACREVCQCASDIAGFDVRKACLKGPMTLLTKTCYQQTVMTMLNVTTLIALRERTPLGISRCAGHSAGEFTALWLAGVFTLETLFRAIVSRSAIMQRLAEEKRGAMYHLQGLAGGKILKRIAEMQLQEAVHIACDNASDRQVIAGEAGAVKAVVNELLRYGVTSTKLSVNGAWHTPMLAEGVAELRSMLSSLPLQRPRLPVYMNRTAAPETHVADIIENLAYQLISPVRWRETMINCQQEGDAGFLEISPRKYLLSLIEESNEPLRKIHYRELLTDLPAY